MIRGRSFFANSRNADNTEFTNLSYDVRLPFTTEKTMKVMAIGTLKPLSPEQRQRYLPKEVPASKDEIIGPSNRRPPASCGR